MFSLSRVLRLIILLVPFILFGCSSNPIRSIHDSRIAVEAKQESLLDVKFVKQTNYQSCGAAVLESVTSYWEKPILQSKILETYPISANQDGYSLGDLKKIAKQANLKAFTFSIPFLKLKEQVAKKRPVIVPVIKKSTGLFLGESASKTFNHYLIIIAVNQQDIWYIDPSEGLSKIKIDAFLNIWQPLNNAALLVVP